MDIQKVDSQITLLRKNKGLTQNELGGAGTSFN